LLSCSVFEGCGIFSSFDLSDAYYMKALDPDSRDVTVFTASDNNRRMRFSRGVIGGRGIGMAEASVAATVTLLRRRVGTKPTCIGPP
jgi:hypothetical protein